MNRGIRLRRRATTGAIRLHRIVTGATRLHLEVSGVIRLHRARNHAAAAVVAVHRHTAAEVRLPMVAAVVTAIRSRPRIPSTVSVLAPSLRI